MSAGVCWVISWREGCERDAARIATLTAALEDCANKLPTCDVANCDSWVCALGVKVRAALAAPDAGKESI